MRHLDPAAPSTWAYHPSLDGLRALAVYLVVLYHCRVDWLPGGFVGVDLFFVLSGFLVSTILFEELSSTGRLDLAHFYDRRMRRLLPAAVVVVIATSALSLVFLSSVRREPLIADAQAALLYVANWHFLIASNDYFAAAGVHDSLFLHFWSLSIEEQFYFLFPVLLLVLHRADRAWRRTTVTVLAVLLVASLVAQLWWMRVDLNHAYYGTETRFYQLLAGALLGLALHRLRRADGAVVVQGRSRVRPGAPALAVGAVAGVALVGMVLVATPVVGLNPSLRGIAATVCAVLLIATLALANPTAVARLFSQPQIVHLGKISYGTYLWHWPLVVLLREVVTTSPAVTATIVTVLSTALAATSFQMLERPIRARRVARPWRAAVLATGLAASVTAALVVVPGLLERETRPDLVAVPPARVGTTTNVEGEVPRIDFQEVAEDKGWDEQSCAPGRASECVVVDGQSGPNVMLVGDSHARMLGPALGILAKEQGFNLSVQILGSCPWLQGLVTTNHARRAQEDCARARNDLYDTLLEESDTDIVVLTQQGRDNPFWNRRLARSPGEASREPLAELLADTTEQTLRRLADRGIRTLVVHSIWLPPNDYGNPLDCLARAERLQQCRVPISPAPGLLDAYYLAVSSQLEGVHTVDINLALCPAAPVCDPLIDGIPVWRDAGHYTPAAISHQRELIWRAIRETGVFDGLT